MIEPVRFRLLTRDKREAEDVAATVQRQIMSEAAKLSPGAEPRITVESESRDHQEVGAILAIILAGPAVVAVAKVFADWVCDRGYGLEVTSPSGEKLTLRNADRELVEKTIQSYAER